MYGRIMEAALLIEHRHDDGTWSRLEPSAHDAAAHDPEREWVKGKTIYTCPICDEQVRVDDSSRERGEEAV